MKITTGMKVCISLKELYENNCDSLRFGGRIIHSKEDEKEFYDLYRDDDSRRLFLCDGEEVTVLEKTNSSIIVETELNCRIWFTPEEFEIATFAQTDNEEFTAGYGIALRENYGTNGLSRNDVVDLFDMLNDVEAFPIELEAREHESSAMGFITPGAANLIDYDYERSGFHDFIASILDDMEKENDTCEYEFKGIRIWLSR